MLNTVSVKGGQAKLLYSGMKIFHFKDKIDSLPVENNTIMPPLQIRIKPTNICNHNCWYCAYRKENIQLGKDMVAKDQIPREKMMELIDDFQDMGLKALTFSGGGEPLCYPHLSEALNRLSATDIKLACITNGSRLNGEVAEIFSKKGTWIRVSMDGWDSESYASCRGVSNDEFKKVMGNLENFKKIGGPCYLGVVINVDAKVAPHLYDAIRNLKNAGVDSVKVSPCIISNDSTENDNYHMTFLREVESQVNRAMSDFSDHDFEIFNSYHLQLEGFEKDYTWCPYVQIKPVIGADLNVYSCQDKAYNIEEGAIFSVKDQSFKKAWYSDKSNFMKINPSIHCRHHCVGNGKNMMILEYLNVDKEHVMFV